MAKPAPLTPQQARKTLAARFAPRVDRLRQLATRFGIRPYRLFLVWTSWQGEERGEGLETEIGRAEVLPTPQVESLDAVALSPMSAGTLAMGMIRVSKVSASAFTEDQLRGLAVPGREKLDHLPETVGFFYELVEDGRGDDPPWRAKYRLATTPFRRAGKLDWSFMLERVSEDRSRAALSVRGSGER